MPHRIRILRRPAAAAGSLAVAVAVIAVCIGVAGPGPRTAHAQEECDAHCWAILVYLTEQGLTPQEIEDLGNSGIPPDPDTPEEFFQRPAATTTPQPPRTDNNHGTDNNGTDNNDPDNNGTDNNGPDNNGTDAVAPRHSGPNHHAPGLHRGVRPDHDVVLRRSERRHRRWLPPPRLQPPPRSGPPTAPTDHRGIRRPEPALRRRRRPASPPSGKGSRPGRRVQRHRDGAGNPEQPRRCQ